MQNPPLRRHNDPESGSTVTLRALVVDDHDEYREYVTSLVSGFGFHVTACADGAEAIEVLSSGVQLFDLLIVDYQMPRIDGFGVIGAVRKHEHHRDVYAIMLSACEDV